MTVQLEFFDAHEMHQIDKGQPGAIWWAGDYECQNFNGWYLSRWGGEGHWQFHIYGFGNDEVSCSVYRLNTSGALELETVPIDEQDRITIDGKKYGREHWNH